VIILANFPIGNGCQHKYYDGDGDGRRKQAKKKRDVVIGLGQRLSLPLGPLFVARKSADNDMNIFPRAGTCSMGQRVGGRMGRRH